MPITELHGVTSQMNGRKNQIYFTYMFVSVLPNTIFRHPRKNGVPLSLYLKIHAVRGKYLLGLPIAFFFTNIWGLNRVRYTGRLSCVTYSGRLSCVKYARRLRRVKYARRLSRVKYAWRLSRVKYLC
jgi:hypothetical protein